jgi:hypothetical protein
MKGGHESAEWCPSILMGCEIDKGAFVARPILFGTDNSIANLDT